MISMHFIKSNSVAYVYEMIVPVLFLVGNAALT